MRKEDDIILWKEYNNNKNPQTRMALLKQFDSIIQSAVNKWAGPIPREVLENEAKILAIKAFDSFDPNRGVLLSTHVTNNLAPLSRIVYSHQNTIRIPENSILKINNYITTKDRLITTLGRDPTTDEIHQHTGFSSREIAQFEKALSNNLLESGPSVSSDFFRDSDDADKDLLAAVYFDLSPEEKMFFEDITGYNNKPLLSTDKLLKKYKITQSQLSYKKTLLTRKIEGLLNGLRVR